MKSINRRKGEPQRSISFGFMCCAVTFTALCIALGIAYVSIKNQQYVLGEHTRKIEASIREITSYNQVLRSEINHLASHAQISAKVAGGIIALVPISDQYVARLNPPIIVVGTGDVLQTAMAGTIGLGEIRP
jgi:hypothetical protein